MLLLNPADLRFSFVVKELCLLPPPFRSFRICEFTISDVQMWPIFISSFILRYWDCNSLSLLIIHKVKESEREEISCCSLPLIKYGVKCSEQNRGGKCISKIKSRKMKWCRRRKAEITHARWYKRWGHNVYVLKNVFISKPSQYYEKVPYKEF